MQILLMTTVATLTRNVRLSKETIHLCRNIIENSDPNPHDKNRSTDTLAEIFYRNGGFDTTINREFSESAIKKILKGGLVDDLTVREFLFFLKIIPQTDPDDGIDAFLDKSSSKTSSTISPYPLSRETLNFDGLKISLSREASKRIQKFITSNELSQRSIATQCGLSHTCIHDTLMRLKSWPKSTFERILTAFLENGVITLPEGETLENLLSTDQEPPHTLTEGDIGFKENKVFLSKRGFGGIKNVIVNRGLSKQTIVQNLHIGQSTFYQALRGEKVTQEALKKILQGLIAEGVIAPLPEGQTLEQLLYPESKTESSCTPTSETLNITESCAAVAGGGRGGGEIPALTALLQPSPQQR
jgi:predicted XRE-type DNA-binding protein